MQTFRTLIALAVFCFGPAAEGLAQDSQCSGASVTHAATLSALPAALRTALANGSPGGRIADVNESYNSTDLIFDMPDQRFRSGKLTPDCAAISIETGRGHSSRVTIIFRRTGEAWAESVRVVMPAQWRR